MFISFFYFLVVNIRDTYLFTSIGDDIPRSSSHRHTRHGANKLSKTERY